MAVIATCMAFVSLTQAGLHVLDAAEAGRRTSEALGQTLETAMADGSITIEYDGLNTDLLAIDPGRAVAPGSGSSV
ncbi:MAG: hypothetical protein NCW75_06085 [Phycisphaera sp.]|nr:MAG: hypothetical protein NCW75_06085 [Phycisphaera sp.]